MKQIGKSLQYSISNKISRQDEEFQPTNLSIHIGQNQACTKWVIGELDLWILGKPYIFGFDESTRRILW